jgi:hypothetical protein
MRVRWIGAVGLAAVGLVWIGQGLGLLRGASPMVDDPTWAIAGAVLLVGAIVIAWLALRDRRSA